MPNGIIDCMKVTCTNCRLFFNADDNATIRACPRCSSGNLKKEFEKKDVPSGQAAPKKIYTSAGVIYGETKEAWRSFHGQDVKTCPKCGGVEFELNFKRKEKVCKKCGEVLALPRRYA